MSKFNVSTAGTRTTINKAGGKAYSVGDKETLTKMVFTSFFKEPAYYGDPSNKLVELTRSILSVDAKYIANLAIYAREVMHLRSVAQVLVTELANHKNGKPFVRKTINKVTERVDDLTEILSYQISEHGRTIPNSMKKGIADVFPSFDEHTLAKYDRAKAVKLKDILCLTHPVPVNTEQSAMWKRLLEGELATPITWETQVSKDGNKAEVWDKLIADRKLGYMAALRNLRNIVQSNAKNLPQVLDYIKNPTAVANGKQLPFRYLSAFRELEEVVRNSTVLDAICEALDLSVVNMPKFEGKTFMTCDNSGSMDSKLSQTGKISYKDVGMLMMAMATGFCTEATTSVFGDNFKLVTAPSRDTSISKMKSFARNDVGWSTNLWKSVQWALQSKTYFDRMIVFTDEQCYNTYGRETAQSYFSQYLQTVNPNCIMHLINLKAYDNTTQFIGHNVNYISGWSDKIFEFIPAFEGNEAGMIEKVDNYYFK
jgi:hypothetical protein